MTKLMEWLLVGGTFLTVWSSIITNKIETPFTKQYMHLILASPLILLILFGMYAVFVVLYRVFTFNNCEEAAVELKKEIVTAREDLKKKGFVF